jgi:hypothetical protein
VLFALHPVTIEAHGWINGRSDALASAFTMAPRPDIYGSPAAPVCRFDAAGGINGSLRVGAAVTRHLGWVAVLAMFCGAFTLLPGLCGYVIGSLAPRHAARPFRSSFELLPWQSDAAPALLALARRADPVHARFGVFAAHVDPGFDMFHSVYPAYLEARAQLRSGQLPLWNEHVLAGSPLLGSSMVQPASPFFWLSLVGDAWSGYMRMLFAQALACALSFYAWLRLQGRSGAAATAAALTLTFTGEMLLFLPYGTVLGGFACVPWALLASERLLRRDGGNSARLALLLALAMGGLWLATNLQFAAYALALQLAWCAWCAARAARDANLRASGIGSAALATALGIAVASVQLLPVFEALSASGRDPDKYAGFNRLQPELLLTVFFPSLLGDTRDGTYAGGVLMLLPPGSAHLLTFGALAWGLALAGALRPTRDRAFWLVFALGPSLLLLAANVAPVAALLRSVPGFGTSHGVRVLAISAIGVAVLASAGLDELIEGASRAQRALFVFCALQLAVVGGLALYGRTGADLFAAHVASLPLHRYLSALVPCAGAAALAWWAWRRAGWRIAIGPGIAGLVCLELALMARGRLEYARARALYEAPPIVRELQHAHARRPGRFVGLTEPDSYPPYQGDNLPPNLASVYGLDDVRGFVPVPTLEQELSMALAENAEQPAHFPGAVVLSHLRSPWLDRAGVRYAMSSRAEVPAQYRRLREGEPHLYENTRALPIVGLVSCAELVGDERELARRATSEPWRDRLLLGRDAARELALAGAAPRACVDGEVAALTEVPTRSLAPGGFEAVVHVPARGAYLRIARSYVPGFRALVNGKQVPVLRADYALQCVALPGGKSRVQVRYEPTSVADGLRLSAGALACIGLLGLLAARARRRA